MEEMFLIPDVFVKTRPKWGTEMRHAAGKQLVFQYIVGDYRDNHGMQHIILG